MDCCAWAERLDEIYDEATAKADLAEYHRAGPRPHTRFLVRQIQAADASATSLLDVGGGAGAIQHELALSGYETITGVDASTAYLRVAEAEAGRLGYGNRARYVHGDFSRIHAQVPHADVVTLDRVLCCFPDAAALLDGAASRARRMIGLVYPRDNWWVRALIRVEIAYRRMRGYPDRAWIHPTAFVQERLGLHGFVPRASRTRFYWRSELYVREDASA